MPVDETEDTVPGGGQNRWRSRRVLAALVSAAVFLVPVALSIVSAAVVAHVIARPRNAAAEVVWWAVVLLVPTAVLMASDRVVRRALPLAVLLRLTMAFPDRAPKRVAVARRVGGTRDLARRVEHAREHGVADEPVLAAERILTLAAALNAHDRLTRGHAERVRAYTDLVAERLELSQDERDRLRWSALLHDIGKLAVHPDVLNKPGKLTDDEWEIVRRHPLEGARLTAPLAAWLGPWANTIAEHHEKFDGTGYPHALAGNDISLGGRIVAVADCYDTMTALRTYRRPMSHAAARTELAACAGTHFDPRVVRAFLDVSLGRLRPVAGPLTWLGALPFVGNVSSLGQAAAVLGRAAAAAVTVTAAVTVGALHAATGTSPPAQAAARTVAGGVTEGGTAGAWAHGTAGGASSRAGSSAAGAGGGAGATGGSSKSDSGAASALSSGSGGSTGGTSGSGSGAMPGAPGSSASPSSSPPSGAAPSWGTTTTSPGEPMPPTTAANTTTTSASYGTLVIRNGTGNAGRPEQGDQIVVTFASPPHPSAFCSGWNTSSAHSLTNPNVVVTGTHSGGGDNTLTVSDTSDCAGGLHFGSIELGQAGYFNGSSTTFGGSSLVCNGLLNLTGCGTIAWDGHNTLTVTLGRTGSGQPTKKTPDVAVYTPDAALGVAGTIKSPSEVQF